MLIMIHYHSKEAVFSTEEKQEQFFKNGEIRTISGEDFLEMTFNSDGREISVVECASNLWVRDIMQLVLNLIGNN